MDITFVLVLVLVTIILVVLGVYILCTESYYQTEENNGDIGEYYLEPTSCGGYYLMKRVQSTMSPDEPIKMVSSVEEVEEIISNMSRPIINLNQTGFRRQTKQR